ncbi:hypothetical protein C1646_764282 [Rhizophagus diaphanus]|nr:hypothetical protein C1646_764282 [Rhizophagus diaphanus] [Rhizophagus sp. MUCL 43196]
MGRCNELEEIAKLNEPDIMNHEITQEVINTIGIGIYHRDGWNVGRKIKHVMVTLMILNHKEKYHHADYHYTTILYPGSEKYETLEFILSPLLNELRSLKENGLEISGIL